MQISVKIHVCTSILQGPPGPPGTQGSPGSPGEGYPGPKVSQLYFKYYLLFHVGLKKFVWERVHVFTVHGIKIYCIFHTIRRIKQSKQSYNVLNYTTQNASRGQKAGNLSEEMMGSFF